MSQNNHPLGVTRGDNNSVTSDIDFSSDKKKRSKTLIICIDRDDDIGVKAGIKTPIIGRDACVAAATKLAVNDPEEADANAIFAAVREYDLLMSKGEFCEVIAVSGLFERGVMGDRKIRSQVAQVLQGYRADGAVLISDGSEGEELAPVIQSLVPIISLKKIVIKHSKSVEESYAVLGRYLKMLLFDSRYSKYALGVPGVIFIGLVFIAAFYPKSVGLVLTVFVGIIFVIRGFDIDRKIESIGKLSASGYLRLFSTLASILIIIVGIATGLAIFFPSSSRCTTAACLAALQAVTGPSKFVLNAPKLIGYFIQSAELFVWLGIGVYIAGLIFFNMLRPKSRHIARYIVELFVLGLLYFPVSIFAGTISSGGSNSDQDVAIIMFAVAVNFSVAAYLYREISNRRKETQAIEV
ncbi:MAG: DUF373 family protein [Nitrososphaerales archaeon]